MKDQRGVTIVFNDGSKVSMDFPRQSPDEIAAMLKLNDGDFALDPNFTALQQVIMDSSEVLLLEGMRCLDEGAR